MVNHNNVWYTLLSEGDSMASYTIQNRKKSDGSVRYRCIVRIGGGNQLIYTESKTFSKKQQAKAWGMRRASELEEHGTPNGKHGTPKNNITIGQLISIYLEDPDLGGKAGRTKRYTLNMLADCDIANIKAQQLEERDLIQHCRDRRSSGAGPATINQDISFLRAVFKSARPVFNIEITDAVIASAMPTLTRLELVGKSQRRSRRPTSSEIDLLLEELKKREGHRNSIIPFCDILNFSILSCMRIGEVCRIRWDDLVENKKTVLVRDRKDPRKKTGNHMYVPLLGEAWDIVQRQQRTDDRIFPFNEKCVSAGFQRVRNKLGINDLRYHDLRREGASRLFEKGFSVEQVAQVTGHRDINILWKVYTELYPEDLHSIYNRTEKDK